MLGLQHNLVVPQVLLNSFHTGPARGMEHCRCSEFITAFHVTHPLEVALLCANM